MRFLMNKILSYTVTRKMHTLVIPTVMRTGDFDAYILRLTLPDMTLTGDVRIRFRRSDGADYITEPIPTSGNTIEYTLSSVDLACPSPLQAWLQISDNNLITPLRISFTGIEGVPSGTPLPEVNEYPELLRRIDEATAATESANESALFATAQGSYAQNAASEALNAKSDALLAASQATEAATQASMATSETTQATQLAINAASQANDATTLSTAATTHAEAQALAAANAATLASDAANSVNAAKSEALLAASSANVAALTATEAASAANESAQDANTAADQAYAVALLSITAEDVPSGNPPTATLSDTGSGKVLSLGIPRGKDAVNLYSKAVDNGYAGSEAEFYALFTGLSEPIYDAILSSVTAGITSHNEPDSLAHPQMQADVDAIIADRSFYSLKAAGAVGDGVIDDTSALESAIQTCMTTGKVLYVNNGTFRFTRRLNIPDSISILGASHDLSVLFFDGGPAHAETPYDSAYWQESNAAISIQSNNCRLENFTLAGGTKASPSAHYGIIYHFPNASGTNYSSAERVFMTNLDIRCFRSGEYRYAGWNRYTTCCQYIDNAEYGIRWYPLESATVGNWAGSGDVLISNQFIGNGVAGIGCTALFETTFFNCVFEYNARAIEAIRCNDVTFKNCWNEANTGNIYVVGCLKFDGGYNIQPSTVDHVPESGGDIVVFDSKSSTVIYSGDTIVYNQQGGIITKGVELAAEIDNMLSNPDFLEFSGGTQTVPSMLGWDVYGPISANGTTRFMGRNTAEFLCSGRGYDVYFGFRQNITVEVGKTYTVTFMAMTPDRSAIDSSGLCCYIAHKNPAGEVSWNDNRFFSFVADNTWEEKSFQIAPGGDDASLFIGFGCYRNGHVFFANPTFASNDSLTANNVFVRKVSASSLSITDLSGVTMGTVKLDAERDSSTSQSIQTHNTDASAHADLRSLITDLQNRVSALET